MDARLPRAWFLPSDLEPLLPGRERAPIGGAAVEVPRLEAGALRRIAAALAARGERIAGGLTTSRLVGTLGAVASSWLDPAAPHRLEAERLLPAASGYAPAMVAEALDRLFTALRPECLDDLLRAEVGHLHSRPPRLLAVIGAASVFPPAIVGAVLGLLLRSPVLVKPATSEPLLASLWAATVAARDPDLGALVAVLPWSRARPELTAAALGATDAVIAHGDDETIAALRAAAPPGARFVDHGHRVSAAIVGALALAADSERIARELAADIALYDQEGCLSPHTVFVEEGGIGVRAFAGLLALELADLERRWPRARCDRARASALRQFLGAWELRAAAGASGAAERGPALLGGFESNWAIVVDPTPGFAFSPLGRTVIVKPVERIAAAIEALSPVRAQLAAVGLAVPHVERLALARRLGLYDDVETNLDWAPRVRLCPVGAMQAPPLTWPADGHRPLGSLCPRGAGAGEDAG